MPIDRIFVTGNQLHALGKVFTCAFGKGGFKADKREGDGATPVGTFALRELLYRPDRHKEPQTELPVTPIAPEDGWCDDPASELYNLPIKTPFSQSHEQLWRDDGLYDFIIPMGYNDHPPEAGKGSAIFMHIAKPNYEPTEGCIALALEDMLQLLPHLSDQTVIEIREK